MKRGSVGSKGCGMGLGFSGQSQLSGIGGRGTLTIRTPAKNSRVEIKIRSRPEKRIVKLIHRSKPNKQKTNSRILCTFQIPEAGASGTTWANTGAAK